MRLHVLLPTLFFLCCRPVQAGVLIDWARCWLTGKPWQEEKQALLRKGEPLKEADFGFENVPDEKNFLLGNLFAPSIQSVRPFVMRKGDEFPIKQGFFMPEVRWNAGIIQSKLHIDPAGQQWLDTFLPLAEVDLLERPQSQLPFATPRLGGPIPAFSSIFGEMKSLAGAATWLIRHDRPADALMCIRTGLRIARGFGHGDGLVSALVNTAVGPLPQAAIWEGLCRGVWNEEQLKLLDEELAGIEFFRPAVNGFRWERCAVLHHMERAFHEFRELPQQQFAGSRFDFEICSLVPRFADENLVFYARTMTSFIDALESRTDRDPTHQLDLACRGPALPWNFLGKTMVPAVSNFFGDVRAADARNSLARWHIALQRHRMQHGSLPKSLEQLDTALRPLTPPVPGVPQVPGYEVDGSGQGRLWFVPGAVQEKNDFNWHLQIGPEPEVWPP